SIGKFKRQVRVGDHGRRISFRRTENYLASIPSAEVVVLDHIPVEYPGVSIPRNHIFIFISGHRGRIYIYRILHYIGSPDHHTRRHLMDTFPLKLHRRGRYDKKSMSVIFIKKWKFHPANAFLARK